MLSKIGSIMLICLFFGLAGCSNQSNHSESHLDSGDPESSASDETQSKLGSLSARNNVITMSFTKWGDVIAVDAGLVNPEAKDGKCKFAKPIKSDPSTRWNPFQIYWVIFDRQDDVRNGKELTGVFAEGESHKADSLLRTDGARPHGFSYLTDQAAGYVNMTEVEMFDDETRLQTVLNVSGHKAAIRSFAEMAAGNCTTRTEACRGGTECYENGVFSKLGNIHVVQNIVGLPREVKQEPTNRVARSN
jgi:hypothetical protein